MTSIRALPNGIHRNPVGQDAAPTHTSNWLSVLACLLLLTRAAVALDELSIGAEGDVSWAGDVSGTQVEVIEPAYRSQLDPNVTELGTAQPGVIEFADPDFADQLLPRRVREGENVAIGLLERGGDIAAPTVVDISNVEKILKDVIRADPTGTALQRAEVNARGTVVTLDLGARFGVNLIRFFPRNSVFPEPATPFQSLFLRNFKIRINDGVDLTNSGNPNWEDYEIRSNNTEAVTTVEIDPPRYIRFVWIEATTAIPFEIEKIQVFGEGFVPSARYQSPIIDMVAPANWGFLRWSQQELGDPDQAGLQIRTRTGTDPTPFAYTRKQVGKQDAEELASAIDDPSQPLSRRDYLRLPVQGGTNDIWERGSVREDLVNWSPWSAPYDGALATTGDGTRVLSPGPRRYFQMRADFSSSQLQSAVVLERLSFDFVSPPLADELVAEVFPREVPASTDIPFVFAVRAQMETEGLQGFDAFELTTRQPVQRIERIEILDRGVSVVDHTFAVQDAITKEGEVAITALSERGFTVKFPRIVEDGRVLKIHFVARVLAYSTTYGGRALLLEGEGFQDIKEGNVAFLGPGDNDNRSGVTVLSPSVTRGSLIRNFAVDRALSPNGDGRNEAAEISFELVAVVGQAQIRVDVFDLAGRRVRRLFDAEGENGLYNGVRFRQLVWNGKDGSGQTVAPGVYLLRLEAAGDARSSAEVRPIAVVY